jgi:uncharacterized membrane protein YdbT with pleckstrin-like domain
MPNPYLTTLLGENERVLFTTRQHWTILLYDLLSEVVLMIVLATVLIAVQVIWVQSPMLYLGYLVLLLPALSIVKDVLTWQSRQYVITNWRVIQIAGIFNKEVTDSSLDKVNDVKLSQSALGRMLDYGTVEILTASELGVNLFRKVGSPIRFKTAMLNAKAELEDGRGISRPTADGGVVDLLGQLESLRKSGVLTDAEFAAKKADLLGRM